MGSGRWQIYFKCDAHLRLIDEEGELGVSFYRHGRSQWNLLFWLLWEAKKKSKEYDIDVEFSKRKQGKVGISESVRPNLE